MLEIINKTDCCGCGACAMRCPKKCIDMKPDNEGFIYPSINKELCVECGLCEKVCNVLHPYEKRKPISVIAANSNNLKDRLLSSSGGVFTLIAEHVLSNDGVVFGARFDKDWQVVIDSTENIKGLKGFRGSKYVQASTKNSFVECEKQLKSGRSVLYTGTPCQVSGLKHYLKRDYDNLLTVDFVCHGVPSPAIWGAYIREKFAKRNKIIKDVRFRDKNDEGWKAFHLAVDYEYNGEVYNSSSSQFEDPYMRAFLGNLILRPSCSNCQSKCNRSHSDITIADYWGVEVEHPELFDDKGTSLLLVNTSQGEEYLSHILQYIDYRDSSYEKALKHNCAISDSWPAHKKRDSFFKEVSKHGEIEKTIIKYLKPSLYQRIHILLACIKNKIIKIIRSQ